MLLLHQHSELASTPAKVYLAALQDAWHIAGVTAVEVDEVEGRVRAVESEKHPT